MSPRVLSVGFFTSPGAVADNFHTVSAALARQSRTSILTSVLLEGRPVPGAADASYLDFSKRHPARWLSPASWTRLARFARRHPYDLVFLYGEHPLHAAILPLARARRSLFWCLDPTPHSGARSTIATIYEVAKRSLLRQADRVVVACEALRGDVTARYGVPAGRVMSCFHGVLDNLCLPLGASARDIDVLFFGRLEAYKGVDVLVEALRLLHARGQAPRTLIAGPGAFPDPGLPDVRIESRYLPDPELASLVARARLVVMPYRDATGSQVPQTAFWYGTPVIASAVGCLPAYVEDGVSGVLVPPADAPRLADAIGTLLADPVRWEAMSRAAMTRARTTFDNDRLMREMLEGALGPVSPSSS